MSKFEQFFSSDKVMITSFVITLVSFGVQIVMESIGIASDLQRIFSAAFSVIMFFIALSMYRSFAKHETNAMNIVTGAAIGILLICVVQSCVTSIVYASSLALIICPAIDAALYAVLLVNHVQINSIHRSTRGRIVLNQVILLVIAAFQIFGIVLIIIDCAAAPEMAVILIPRMFFGIARLFISNMIICIEAKLNAYKTDRDVAKVDGTWTWVLPLEPQS